MAGDPLQFEAGPGDGGRIGRQRPQRVDVVGGGEGRDFGGGALVVPQLHRVERQAARRVEQHRAMHLAAGRDGQDALCAVVRRRQDRADAFDRPLPPVGGALLRPAEGRHDLLVLAGVQRDDSSAQID